MTNPEFFTIASANLASDPVAVACRYELPSDPLKTAGEKIPDQLLGEQAAAAAAPGVLVEVNYKAQPGTCSDERPRVGLLSGEARVEPRPSTYGGPNVYLLAVAELTGFFAPEDKSTGEARLRRITDLLEVAGFQSGGHRKCAANAGFGVWMRLMTENGESIRESVRSQLGDRYSPDAMSEVLEYAEAVVASGRYDDWNEDILQRVLGDKAGDAIEVLVDEPHGGKSEIRNNIPNTTVDQTPLAARSVVGKGSYVVDNPYAAALEQVVASGADAEQKLVVARHAREAIIAAIHMALPSTEIRQINFISPGPRQVARV